MTLRCRSCPQPATHTVTAGRPGHPDGYKTAGACQQDLERTRRWATSAGRPIVTTLDGAPEPAQSALFDLEAS
jgi:hypothetical protein